METTFLPTTKAEMKKQGIDQLDVVLVTADAYIDHPSFGAAIVGRYLESLGLKVGIIPQPDWRDHKSFMILGKPKLFFGVTAGNLDSMVALYTAGRKIRSDDPYSEGGRAGQKPYLPTIIYTNKIRQAFKGVPVVIGGIEASLRRMSHYDFYQDKVRQSILLDSKADLLVYGNGERPLKELTERLKDGQVFKGINDVRGTAVPVFSRDVDALPSDHIVLPAHEEVKEKKQAFGDMTKMAVQNIKPINAKTLFQRSGSRGVRINPSAEPLSEKEIDQVYDLSFTRLPHPRYRAKIPAYEMIKDSITSHRGCYGGCHFCSLAMHQGKIIQSRSPGSIKKEAGLIAKFKQGKKTVITDIGGPTANMYGTGCSSEDCRKNCQRHSCLYPNVCTNLKTAQKKYRELLKDVRNMPKVNHVYINSGIRYDLVLEDEEMLNDLAQYYTPGHLSVAPEHVDDQVLALAGKPTIACYDKFELQFNDKSRNFGKKHYVMPYFIVGLPGDDEKSRKKLRRYFIKKGIKMRQIQEFYPTPMTISTAIYFCGYNPLTGDKVDSVKKLGVKKMWKQDLAMKSRY